MFAIVDQPGYNTTISAVTTSAVVDARGNTRRARNTASSGRLAARQRVHHRATRWYTVSGSWLSSGGGYEQEAVAGRVTGVGPADPRHDVAGVAEVARFVALDDRDVHPVRGEHVHHEGQNSQRTGEAPDAIRRTCAGLLARRLPAEPRARPRPHARRSCCSTSRYEPRGDANSRVVRSGCAEETPRELLDRGAAFGRPAAHEVLDPGLLPRVDRSSRWCRDRPRATATTRA